MLLSSVSFALINLIVKILSGSSLYSSEIQVYPVYELIFFRSIVSLLISIAIIRSRKIPFFGVNKKWLLVRGIFGATSLTLFFITLKNLPIAIATIVQYLSPIFTIIFAIYLNKERVRSIQWLFFLISFVGVAIIGYGKSGDGAINPIWLLTGLLSAILSGVAYNAIIKCKETDQPITVVMYFPLVAAPVSFIIMLIMGTTIPNGIEWFLLILIGVLTQIAQVCMTRAFNSDAASKITPVKYVGAIYAVIIGYFVFDETLSLYATFGIILILIGVLLNTFIKKSKLVKQS